MPLAVVLGFVVVFALVLVCVSVGLKFYETRRKRHVTEMLDVRAAILAADPDFFADAAGEHRRATELIGAGR